MPSKRDSRKVTVVGIAASPRRGGNSEILLDKSLEGARSKGASVKKIVLNELSFKPCQGCGGCLRTGRCVLRDDLTAIYPVIARADSVIFSSAVYFLSVTAQAKMFIDRFQARWVAYRVLKQKGPKDVKRGAFLCVSGSKKSRVFEGGKRVVKAFFNTLGIHYSAEIMCAGTVEKSDVLRRKDVIRKAYKIGADLVIGKI
jgi:multimeric flavodoxin WrbA